MEPTGSSAINGESPLKSIIPGRSQFHGKSQLLSAYEVQLLLPLRFTLWHDACKYRDQMAETGSEEITAVLPFDVELCLF